VYRLPDNRCWRQLLFENPDEGSIRAIADYPDQSDGSPEALILDWQRELKNRASWHVCCRPQTSLMSLDNRTANR
jgi:hypothetical protein